MRKHIIASSWKMHINSIATAVETAKELKDLIGKEDRVDIFFMPTFPIIPFIRDIFKGTTIKWGAQNMCYEDKGAFTGEVPPQVLKDLDCSYVEIGHAERRAYFNERDVFVNKKVKLALKYGLIPVVCIGESENDKFENVIRIKLKTQVLWALDGLNENDIKKVIFAYEPVWAIGKSQSASPDYVQDIHFFVRNIIKKEYGDKIGEDIRIIYGGSVSPQNSVDLTAKEDIDGLFIGRFGLKPENFKEMVNNDIRNKK